MTCLCRDGIRILASEVFHDYYCHFIPKGYGKVMGSGTFTNLRQNRVTCVICAQMFFVGNSNGNSLHIDIFHASPIVWDQYIKPYAYLLLFQSFEVNVP